MELIRKRKFRMVVCAFIAYLALVAFCLAYSSDAPVRGNQSMILSDYVTGEELQTLPYGNKSFSMTAFGSRIIHAPVSLMSGEGFKTKFKVTLEGASEANLIVDLFSEGFDLKDCEFETTIHEGENEVEGEIYFEGVGHPQTSEFRIFTDTEGAQFTVTKLRITRIEKQRVGHWGYLCLGVMFVFLAATVVLYVLDRRGAKEENA
ncbi:hypothetical protein SAMN04487770_13121 [Butyrivibrio sp. ob235]|uniref:hypothetical protein n=1 Tax=Butyrivibrio sp. ob235 TaxID=1761780 RepID=UPI0008C4C199|nr:hypothetical protein [Butyrivibrio sp. ob235]SEM26390.1 hypothetical protein SAMN04487770_13121 [Butyrivibrio sp. ob235]